MKKISIVALLLFTTISFGGIGINSFFLAGVLKPTSGGGGGAISDDFNTGSEPSANWTEIVDVDLNMSGQAEAPSTFDFTFRGMAYTGASVTTEQYVKVTLIADTSQRPGVILRFTNTGTEFYNIEFDVDGDLARLEHYTSAAGTRTEINTAAFTITLPTTVGVTITGSGNSTVWRCWLNPTANAPDSASSWDGAGATITFTDDPADAVDSGNFIGIGGIGSGAAMKWDDFFGGPL